MECPIFLENMNKIFQVKSPCNHVFCLNCTLKLNSTLCPLCRTDNKNSFPIKLLNLIKKNDRDNQFRVSSTPNIHNINDFPPLG